MSRLIKLDDAIETAYKLRHKPNDEEWEQWLYAFHAIPPADRPQGEWIDKGRNLWGCSNCGMKIYSESERDRNEFHKWCSRCGCRMKGADDE